MVRIVLGNMSIEPISLVAEHRAGIQLEWYYSERNHATGGHSMNQAIRVYCLRLVLGRLDNPRAPIKDPLEMRKGTERCLNMSDALLHDLIASAAIHLDPSSLHTNILNAGC